MSNLSTSFDERRSIVQEAWSKVQDRNDNSTNDPSHQPLRAPQFTMSHQALLPTVRTVIDSSLSKEIPEISFGYSPDFDFIDARSFYNSKYPRNLVPEGMTMFLKKTLKPSVPTSPKRSKINRHSNQNMAASIEPEKSSSPISNGVVNASADATKSIQLIPLSDSKISMQQSSSVLPLPRLNLSLKTLSVNDSPCGSSSKMRSSKMSNFVGGSSPSPVSGVGGSTSPAASLDSPQPQSLKLKSKMRKADDIAEIESLMEEDWQNWKNVVAQQQKSLPTHDRPRFKVARRATLMTRTMINQKAPIFAKPISSEQEQAMEEGEGEGKSAEDEEYAVNSKNPFKQLSPNELRQKELEKSKELLMKELHEWEQRFIELHGRLPSEIDRPNTIVDIIEQQYNVGLEMLKLQKQDARKLAIARLQEKSTKGFQM